MEEKGKQHHGDKIRYTSVEKSPTIIQVQCNIAIPLFRLWQNNSISRCAQKTPFIQTISRDICISHINTKVPKNLFPISEEDRSRAGGPQAPINTGTQRDNYQIILNIPDIDQKTPRTNPSQTEGPSGWPLWESVFCHVLRPFLHWIICFFGVEFDVVYTF